MKKKQNKPVKDIQEKSTYYLGDLLDAKLVHELKEKKKELQNQDDQKRLAEEERKKEERRLKEKNKSFEELLNESNFNWKEFK